MSPQCAVRVIVSGLQALQLQERQQQALDQPADHPGHRARHQRHLQLPRPPPLQLHQHQRPAAHRPTAGAAVSSTAGGLCVRISAPVFKRSSG